jgi:hypothetical protein
MITISIIQHERYEQTVLAITGKPSLEEAKTEIIRMLLDEEVQEAEGPWCFTTDGDVIVFDNDEVEGSISDADVRRAIEADGKEIVAG